MRFLILFFFSLPLLANSNFEKCQKFLGSYCGSMKWEECAKKPNKKSVQVVQCIEVLMNHKAALKEDDLSPNFSGLVTSFKGKARDHQDCLKTATVVCGDGVGFKECFQKQAGKFPSYCRNMARDNVDTMEAAYKNDPELKGCTDTLVGQCKKDLMALADEKVTDHKKMMASMNKYQKCLKATLPKLKACKSLIHVDKNKPVISECSENWPLREY